MNKAQNNPKPFTEWTWVSSAACVNEIRSLASNLFVFWLTLLINYKHYKYKSYQKANREQPLQVKPSPRTLN
jgi:hypothetical protein